MGRDSAVRSSSRELLGLLKGNGRLLAAAIVVSLLGAASLLLPIIVNQLVKQVSSTGGGGNLSPHVLVACALLLATGLLSALRQYLLYRMGEGIVFNARRKLISSLLRLPIREFDERRSGDLVSRVANDTTVIRLHLGRIRRSWQRFGPPCSGGSAPSDRPEADRPTTRRMRARREGARRRSR